MNTSNICPPVGIHPLLFLENKRRSIQTELVLQVETLRVEVVEHVLINAWEDFNERGTLDFGAVNDPGDDCAEGLLIKGSPLFELWLEFIAPVVVVDGLFSLTPLRERSHHVFVVLSVSSSQISDVSIALSVIEVEFPLWSACAEVLV